MRGAILACCLVILLMGCVSQPVPLTAEQVLASPENYSGKTLTLLATPEPGLTRCTMMACSEENPCCNSCGGQLTIGGISGIVIEGSTCSGNECNLSCSPMEQGVSYSITGTLSQKDGRWAL
ncbi:MAG: hypothetical protein Q7S65_03970, partial [Nanoarchaeota archaeon]|nr:hypothetical protein [Nanoarchaeota archaeon]